MTLDVSKLSGWLNAFVSCRVEREGMGSKARYEQGKARVLLVVHGTSDAHLKHAGHC